MPAVTAGPNERERLALVRALDPLRWAGSPEIVRLCNLAGRMLAGPPALVTVVDAEVMRCTNAAGMKVEIPRAQAICAWTIQGNAVMCVPDTHRDPRFRTNVSVVNPPFIRSYIGAPLIAFPGIHIGALCIIDRKARTFTTAEHSTLAGLAANVMTQLKNFAADALKRGARAVPQ
jgi:GAF domain-containing protein